MWIHLFLPLAVAAPHVVRQNPDGALTSTTTPLLDNGSSWSSTNPGVNPTSGQSDVTSYSGTSNVASVITITVTTTSINPGSTASAPSTSTASTTTLASTGPDSNATSVNATAGSDEASSTEFSVPAENDLWTMVTNTNVARWTPLNETLEVWLSNSDKILMAEDVRLATVPPGTRVLVTPIPNSVNTGPGFQLYLTRPGNTTAIAHSASFSIQSLTASLFSSAHRLAPLTGLLPLLSLLALW